MNENPKISPELQAIIDRCNNLEDVPLDEINNTPELINANAHLEKDKIELTKNLEALRGESLPDIEVSTKLYPDDVLDKRMDDALKKLDEIKSARVDENGKTVYNGDVKRDGHLDIVIGLPASGKSSAVADKLSQKYNSRIIDNDEAKKVLPEYDNGFGAGLVHKESQMISNEQMIASMEKHENLVIPKVGGNLESITDIIDMANKYNYKSINVHYVELPKEKAMGRLLGRLVSQNRYLSPNLINKYSNKLEGNKIEKTYNALKEGGYADGYSKWNNDVKRGEQAKLIESQGIDEFRQSDRDNRGLNRSNSEQVSENIPNKESNRYNNTSTERNNKAFVSDLQGTNRNGKTKPDLSNNVKKPSLRAKLNQNKDIVDSTKKDTPNKSKDKHIDL